MAEKKKKPTKKAPKRTTAAGKIKDLERRLAKLEQRMQVPASRPRSAQRPQPRQRPQMAQGRPQMAPQGGRPQMAPQGAPRPNMGQPRMGGMA